MKVTIIGAGFIGKNLIADYVADGIKVNVLDRNPCPAEFVENTNWLKGSYTEKENVLKSVKDADVVYHLISSTVPGDSVDEQEEIMNNVLPSIQLIKLCIKERVKRIVFISSSSVYGIKNTLPIEETGFTEPISAHGMQKLIIEKFLSLYNYHYNIDCKVMRLSNPFGPHQNIYGRQGFIAIVLGKILSGQPITIRGDGSTIRDFIYISDAIKACKLLATVNTDENVFNIGSGRGLTLMDVIKEIQGITGKKIDIIFAEQTNTDITSSILSIAKAQQTLGFKPEVSLNDGLEKTLSYYKIIP